MKKSKTKSRSLKNSKSFSRSQMILFTLVFALVGGIVIWRSLAASPGGKTTVSPLSLTQETFQWNPNQIDHSCQSEDDDHNRYYSGYLNGTFNATEILCYNPDQSIVQPPSDSGNQGMYAIAHVQGTLSDLTITAPTGVAHHAFLMSTSKDKKTKNYAVCFVGTWYASTDTGFGSLSLSYPGNPWTYSISGSISNVNLNFHTWPMDVARQQSLCPKSEQNIIY